MTPLPRLINYPHVRSSASPESAPTPGATAPADHLHARLCHLGAGATRDPATAPAWRSTTTSGTQPSCLARTQFAPANNATCIDYPQDPLRASLPRHDTSRCNARTPSRPCSRPDPRPGAPPRPGNTRTALHARPGLPSTPRRKHSPSSEDSRPSRCSNRMSVIAATVPVRARKSFHPWPDQAEPHPRRQPARR